MRVLITGPSLGDPGGVAGYFSSVLPHLASQPELDVRYVEIGSTRSAAGRFHVLADQLRFGHALRASKPDLVHVNPSLNLKSFVRDGVFVAQAKQHGHRVIVFFRGWDERFEANVERRWQWYVRATYARADKVIVLASAFRDRLRAWGVRVPIELGTTAVAADLVIDFAVATKLRALAHAELKVLFLARLESDKGIAETLRAVVSLREQNVPVTLTVAGDGGAMAEVRRFVGEHDPRQTVIRIVGDVRGERKKELFASHHIYCSPSYREGMPNAVLEAMAFAMPIVACRTGGLCDILEDGRTGFFVDAGSSAQVAAAIKRLVQDREELREIAHYNHHYSARTFFAPAVSARLSDLYRSVV